MSAFDGYEPPPPRPPTPRKNAALTADQEIRARALSAASGLFIATAASPLELQPIADSVLAEAQRFEAYIRAGHGFGPVSA